MKVAVLLLLAFCATSAFSRSLLQCTSTAIASADAQSQSSVATAVTSAFAECAGKRACRGLQLHFRNAPSTRRLTPSDFLIFSCRKQGRVPQLPIAG